MKVIGLVAEYNPLHLGHIYQLREIKRQEEDALILVLMVGHFSQRGEPTVLSKWERTRLALEEGADLVFELPFCAATASAENYAGRALDLLNRLGIDSLSFGCHSQDPQFIRDLAGKILALKKSPKMKDLRDRSLPSLIFKEVPLSQKEKDFLVHGNDILALEYCQRILEKKMDISLLPIERRTRDPLSGRPLLSATDFRKALEEGNISACQKDLPEKTYALLQDRTFSYRDPLKDLYRYAWHFNPHNKTLKTPVQSFIYREWVEKSRPLEELSSKNFTNAFLRREILSFVFSYSSLDRKKEAALAEDYLRLLGGKKEALGFLKGKQILSKFRLGLNSPLAPLYRRSLQETILRNLLLGTKTPLDYYQSPLIL